MARREGAWESLTPAYRTRLERGGITRESYQAGVRVQTARGHRTAEHRARAENEVKSGKPFRFVSGGEVVTATSRYSRIRSLAASYMSAVGTFLRTGNADGLRRFRGREIEGQALETDPAKLRALARSGDLRVAFYEPLGAAA